MVVSSALNLNLSYDSRNDRLDPSQGFFNDIFFKYSGLGGDLKFKKFELSLRFYQKIFWKVILRTRFSLAQVFKVQDYSIPINEHFLIGGTNSLRAYPASSIGAKRLSSKTGKLEPYGGDKQFLYTLEFQMPVLENYRLFAIKFLDIGLAENKWDFDKSLHSFGLGFRWASPIGLLRFEWAWTLEMLKESKKPLFQFGIGTNF